MHVRSVEVGLAGVTWLAREFACVHWINRNRESGLLAWDWSSRWFSIMASQFVSPVGYIDDALWVEPGLDTHCILSIPPSLPPFQMLTQHTKEWKKVPFHGWGGGRGGWWDHAQELGGRRVSQPATTGFCTPHRAILQHQPMWILGILPAPSGHGCMEGWKWTGRRASVWWLFAIV